MQDKITYGVVDWIARQAKDVCMAQARHFIKSWREYRGLTQEQVADRMDISPQQVSRIETGKRPYTQATLEGFAHAFGCDIADLFYPPPTDKSGEESEFERYVKKFDAERKRHAYRILRGVFDPIDKSA